MAGSIQQRVMVLELQLKELLASVSLLQKKLDKHILLTKMPTGRTGKQLPPTPRPSRMRELELGIDPE